MTHDMRTYVHTYILTCIHILTYLHMYTHTYMTIHDHTCIHVYILTVTISKVKHSISTPLPDAFDTPYGSRPRTAPIHAVSQGWALGA